MADDEATQGATNDVGGTPATNWYHIYVPFNSGTIPASWSPVDPLTKFTADANKNAPTDCLPDPTVSLPLGSFLHLGAMNPDLLSLSSITGANAQFDANAQATFKRALDLTSFVSYGFLDDYRVRGPNASTQGQRQAESANLYSKGGWRDHTDGNRITTTAGDKVEVIGGNHVMIILGRPTDDNSLDNTLFTGTPNTHQIETSGGLSYSNDAGPGHIEEVRWVTRAALGGVGTWMVREKKYLSDEVSIGAGLTHESFVGIGVEINSGTAYSYHGAIENMPPDLLNNPAVNLQDIWRDENAPIPAQPKQTPPLPPLPPAPYFSDMSAAETLVDSITKNSGNVFNASNPVPPQMTVEYTNLDSTYSNATIGTVDEHTTINTSKTEHTTINGTSFSKTTVNGNTSEVSLIAGSKEETDLMIGPAESVAMYMGVKEEISLHAGYLTSIEIGIEKAEISLIPLVFNLGLDTEEFEFKLNRTGIHLEVNEMAAVKTNITEMYNVLSGGVATCLAPMVAMG